MQVKMVVYVGWVLLCIIVLIDDVMQHSSTVSMECKGSSMLGASGPGSP